MCKVNPTHISICKEGTIFDRHAEQPQSPLFTSYYRVPNHLINKILARLRSTHTTELENGITQR